MNRNKVIRGLEACNAGDCDHCPYQHIEPRKEFWDDGLPVCQSGKMLEEALEILRTTSAQLLSLAEVRKSKDIIWLETRADYSRDHKPRLEAAMLSSKSDYELLVFEIQETGRESRTSACYYGRVIRCWDKMPTDEQRKAAEWNDQIKNYGDNDTLQGGLMPAT